MCADPGFVFNVLKALPKANVEFSFPLGHHKISQYVAHRESSDFTI